MLILLVLIVCIVLILGGLPVWGLMDNYYPSGILTIVLVVLLVLFLAGRL